MREEEVPEAYQASMIAGQQPVSGRPHTALLRYIGAIYTPCHRLARQHIVSVASIPGGS